MKKLLLAALSGLLLCTCYAQSDSRQSVLQAMKQLTGRYMDADHVSFDVLYKSANETTPGVYFDSLQGNFKMNGSEYWYLLDSTECIRNKEYSIVLFREDKIMYLSKSSSVKQSMNPLAILDSSFSGNPDFTGSIEHLKGETKLSIRFKPGLQYKMIELYISDKTGFISSMTSVVQQKLLADPSAETDAEPGTPAYTIVEVHFSNYKTRSFSDDTFNSSKYFVKEDTNYNTASPYQSYKIFISNPNL